MDYDVIVLGAGAAGMFCAAQAGARGRRVLLIDHAKKPGEKIRISGGGRCNFTNLNIVPERFLSNNPRFAVSALKRFTQWDFIALVDAAGIAWHEKTLGQLFCDGSATQIIAMLVDRLSEAGVEMRLETPVDHVSALEGGGYQVARGGQVVQAASVVVATGGKSIPKMGATGVGYKIAEHFGLSIRPTRAGLVPLTFGPALLERTRALPGVSVSARVTCEAASFEEGLLFTHRGLSGPSILQASSYWQEGDEIAVDLMVNDDVGAKLSADRSGFGKLSIKNALARHMPEYFIGEVVDVTGWLGGYNFQWAWSSGWAAGQVC